MSALTRCTTFALTSVLLLTLFPVGGAGQQPARAASQRTDRDKAGLRGVVIDARSALPLEGATVSLEPTPAGIVASGEPGVSGFLSSARQSATGRDGSYRFEGLPIGKYRLRVVRIGYRSATIDVHYDGPADPRISIGLEVQPVELEPIAVVSRRPDALPRQGELTAVESESERLQLERIRQSRHLEGDARMLSSSDIVEAVTLGETDLLRALHKLPGVTADDDWSAEPWTRGSRWDETRIYFDGLPLLDPVHFGGAFTSVSPDAIGSVTFHPGVRPAGAGAASAAIVDMRSRPATGPEELSVLGQISMLSERVSVDRPLANGGGITFSGRRSYIEELTRDEATFGQGGYIPFRFQDVAGRLDYVVADSIKLELSGLETEDRVVGDVAHELKGTRATWGNSLLRGTLESTRGGFRTRITSGSSTYRAYVDLAAYDPNRVDLFDATTSAPLNNEVRFDVLDITVAPLSQSGKPAAWQLGAQRVGTRINYNGPAPWPFPDAVNAGTLTVATRLSRYAYWGQFRNRVGPDVELSTGLRLETRGIGSILGGGVALAPRIAARWTARPDLSISAAIGRHHQYEQALAPAGFVTGPALVPTHLWVSARGNVPVMRSDIGTVGAELWLDDGWLVNVNAYLKDAVGQMTPAPDSGYVRARPAVVGGEIGDGWVPGDTRAYGIEFGARKLSGRWTGSASYSLSRARITASQQSFPAPGERTHALDATFIYRLTDQMRLGAAFTATSGAPYTRFFAFRCPAVYCHPEQNAPEVIGFNEAAGAQRAPAFASLDIHLEREGELFGLRSDFFVQLRNALNRDNRSVYIGSIETCGEVWGQDCSLADHFEDGFPFMPLIGFWMRL